MTIYSPLYEEFGIYETHKKRRELTAETGLVPTYIELLAALSLEQGHIPRSPQCSITTKPLQEVENDV
ncbi:MAG: hypothetical protein GY804_11595 [Alphaproteobacteria bacterium]|nr:hypothetical protein [Alphaproteobacteria bacterium]